MSLSDVTVTTRFCETDEHDEMLPFALCESDVKAPLNKTPVSVSSAYFLNDSQPGSLMTVPVLDSIYHIHQSGPPGLASSTTSCRSDESTETSSNASQLVISSGTPLRETELSILPDDLRSSRHLDSAASIMAGLLSPPISASYNQTLHYRRSCVPQDDGHFQYREPLTAPIPGSFSSMGFSRLMQNADEANQNCNNQGLEPDQPGLPEEPESNQSQKNEPFHNMHGDSLSPFPSNIPSTSSRILKTTSDWTKLSLACAFSGYQPPQLDQQCIFRRGQVQIQRSHGLDRSVLRRSGVEIRQVDPMAFEVSFNLFPGCSKNDAMSVIANPAYLVLWSESVQSIVVTNRSEGARSSASGGGNGASERQYEGEWVEASTTDLKSPPSASSCFFNISKAIWNCVGFPVNYGTVSMFVERSRGKVGLSMGPFQGDITVTHSFAVSETKIVDMVTLSRGPSSLEVCCGIFECFQNALLPSVKGYMDQAVSSIIRLRLLIEAARNETMK